MAEAAQASLAGIKKPDQVVTKKGLIVTCQPLAAQIGIDLLRKGANAADAFIATTFGTIHTPLIYGEGLSPRPPTRSHCVDARAL